MPGLLIKDLPRELHRRLRARAAANHRSLGREALLILEEALDERAGPRPSRRSTRSGSAGLAR